ncbi:AraC family transcriptional regulator [Pantoea phytobeneficialis]|uniref:AraC family transcriptional regulator n=1 Tax=Pantoea phytobeneficialis TaxID=2052056 RepID=A0AAP9H2I7_9GAMM|nr:AraC family transcriptional regulator [Pantoea phytobeneficialis]MDO6409690.1 AraC family transcriptional regulator [Pantoea phytobeneficialis]QGR05406.1 AraC family transcriptional regulator [Pantoea phytobeneficialis]
MPVNKTEVYHQRFNKVFDYIDQHLDDPLLLEQLSEVAHFSPYHFHRQFTGYCGVAPGRYIQLMRLKRASYRLAFNPSEKIIDIALDAGFQHAESFSRAFKQIFAMTPSEFRQQPAWVSWHQRMPQLQTKRRETMPVTIINFPATQVAMLSHYGQPERIMETAARFITWRKTTGLSPIVSSQTFGIAHHDPASTPAEIFSFDICGSITAPIPEDNAFGVVNALIPAGRCALLRHHGSHDAIAASARRLYSDWLPANGEELRDFPLFFHYQNFIHDVPEHQLITDIYLPLK